MARLRTEEGTYLWLALDHGLSFGQIEGLGDPRVTRALLSSPHLSGVVVNRGGVAALDSSTRVGLVLQTFGHPALGSATVSKVPTCRVEEAHRLAADAISVQLNLNAQGLSHAVRAVSLAIGDAAFYDLPVLVMVTAALGGDSFEAAADALRISTELGADLIKISLPSEIFAADQSQIATLQQVIEVSPPVLLGGGERRDDFDALLAIAHKLGFSGTCIGRNVFQHPEPETILSAAAAAFSEDGDWPS